MFSDIAGRRLVYTYGIVVLAVLCGGVLILLAGSLTG